MLVNMKKEMELHSERHGFILRNDVHIFISESNINTKAAQSCFHVSRVSHIFLRLVEGGMQAGDLSLDAEEGSVIS